MTSTSTTTAILNNITNSIMLKYEIENTINTIKENNISKIGSMQSSSVVAPSPSTPPPVQKNEINEKSIADHNQLIQFDNTNKINNNFNNSQSIIARKRWKILAKAIKKVDDNNTITSSSSSSSSPSSAENMSSIDSTKIKINNPMIIMNNNYNENKNIVKLFNRTNNGNDNDANDDDDEFLASVRRFSSFDLVNKNHISNADKELLLGLPENWFSYNIIINSIEYIVNIHHINRSLSALDLMGFNNTGNICVWPSEEALAFYALTNIDNFQNKMILELGGGMTCLAGLLIAKYGGPHSVHLTDGNFISIENVKRTLRLNDINCYVKCSQLKWENKLNSILSEYGKFHYILSADCLFFDDVRTSLIDTIWNFLSKIGIALIMAPKRGKTLDEFIRLATEKGFNYEIKYKYNDVIWERHLKLKQSMLYDENLHYPILIKLTK